MMKPFIKTIFIKGFPELKVEILIDVTFKVSPSKGETATFRAWINPKYAEAWADFGITPPRLSTKTEIEISREDRDAGVKALITDVVEQVQNELSNLENLALARKSFLGMVDKYFANEGFEQTAGPGEQKNREG
jgi:hypothetical protein